MNTPQQMMIAAVLGFVAGDALAEGTADLRDDQLLAGVVEATGTEDSDRLLELMLEVRARGLLMFPEVKACGYDVPETPFFQNSFYAGAVRWAFATDVHEMAITQNYCGCPFDLMDFAAFTEKVADKAPEDLTKADDRAFARYRTSEWTPMEQAHGKFRKEICGVDPWQ